MAALLPELGRFLRFIPVEARVRWHAGRTLRHQALMDRHRDAMNAALGDARALLGARLD